MSGIPGNCTYISTVTLPSKPVLFPLFLLFAIKILLNTQKFYFCTITMLCMEIFGFKCQKREKSFLQAFFLGGLKFQSQKVSTTSHCLSHRQIDTLEINASLFFHTSFWHLKKVMIIYFFIPANIPPVRFGALIFYIYNEKVTYSFSSLLLMNNSKRFAQFSTIRTILKT